MNDLSTVDRSVCGTCESPYHLVHPAPLADATTETDPSPSIEKLLERCALDVLRIRVRDLAALEAGMDVITYLELRAAVGVISDLAEALCADVTA